MISHKRGGRPRRHRGNRVAAALIIAGAVILAAGWLAGRRPESPPQPPPAADITEPARRSPSAQASARALGPSVPKRLEIPSLKVDAPVMRIGVKNDGEIEVPPLSKVDRVGWFEAGPTPGEDGWSVLVGHVDSKKKPGVFYKLGKIRPGRQFRVEREDGTSPTFRVYRVQRVEKDKFPTDAVYGNEEDRKKTAPEVRLITCGGSFDKSRGHYTDNIIVYATMTTPTHKPHSSS